MNDCSERMSQAELRLSNVEDVSLQAHLQAKVTSWRQKTRLWRIKSWTWKPDPLKQFKTGWSTGGCRGQDPCSFLEKWIPEVLNAVMLQSSGIIERAHRIGPMKDSKAPPRTLIIWFLNYKDKQTVHYSSMAKKDIRYKDQQI